MAKKFMTAVIEYDDGAELPKVIAGAFGNKSEFMGAKVTAVSLDDEISRVEQLEAQLEA